MRKVWLVGLLIVALSGCTSYPGCVPPVGAQGIDDAPSEGGDGNHQLTLQVRSRADEPLAGASVAVQWVREEIQEGDSESNLTIAFLPLMTDEDGFAVAHVPDNRHLMISAWREGYTEESTKAYGPGELPDKLSMILFPDTYTFQFTTVLATSSAGPGFEFEGSEWMNELSFPLPEWRVTELQVNATWQRDELEVAELALRIMEAGKAVDGNSDDGLEGASSLHVYPQTSKPFAVGVVAYSDIVALDGIPVTIDVTAHAVGREREIAQCGIMFSESRVHAWDDRDAAFFQSMGTGAALGTLLTVASLAAVVAVVAIVLARRGKSE